MEELQSLLILLASFIHYLSLLFKMNLSCKLFTQNHKKRSLSPFLVVDWNIAVQNGHVSPSSKYDLLSSGPDSKAKPDTKMIPLKHLLREIRAVEQGFAIDKAQ